MHFNCTETLRYPLPLVWSTFRDHLPDIAAKLDDIEYVKVDKRTKKGKKSVHIISTWRADPPLPAFLKSFIKPDMLIWTDDAIWDNEQHLCSFSIVTHYKVEDIHCIGTIAFEAVAGGKSTKVIYSGILTIAKTPRSSIFMTGFIIKGIEAVAGTLIGHNFAKVVKSSIETIKSLE